MRGDGGKVGAGGDADPGFPAVRDYLPATPGGHVADFHGFGQASDAADVRLGDVHFSTVHQVGEFVSCGLPFAAGDADAALVVHSGVAVEVVHPEGGLEEVDVEFCPVTDGGERPVGAVPGVLDVYHQGEVRANGFAAGGEYLGDLVVALVHAGVVVGTEQGDLEFGGAETDFLGV